MIRWSILLAVLLAATGCGLFSSDEEPIEPPAELTEFTPSAKVSRVWGLRFGKGSDGLILGLSPATDGGRVFAGDHNGEAVAVDAETGKPVWVFESKLALSAGPGVGNGLVVFGTSDGDVVALNAIDGEELWRANVSGEVLARPAIAEDLVVIRTVDGRVRALDVVEGKELWTVEQQVPRLTLRGNGAPMIGASLIVAGFDNGRIAAYDLDDGDVRWENVISPSSGRSELERLADVDATVQIIGQDLYAVSFNGRVASIALESGRILWSQDLSSYRAIGTDWDNLYLTDDESAIIAMNRSSGAILWQQSVLRLRSLTGPVPFGTTVVAGDFEGYVHWFDGVSGALAARARADNSAIVGQPVVVADIVVVQSDDGHLVAYRITRPSG